MKKILNLTTHRADVFLSKTPTQLPVMFSSWAKKVSLGCDDIIIACIKTVFSSYQIGVQETELLRQKWNRPLIELW